MEEYIRQVSQQYGLSPDAVRKAWELTASKRIEEHVKRFKAYMTNITGMHYGNLETPQMSDEVQENLIKALCISDLETIVNG